MALKRKPVCIFEGEKESHYDQGVEYQVESIDFWPDQIQEPNLEAIMKNLVIML